MTTVAVVASRPITRSLPLWRKVAFRTGVVLTTVMGVFNTVNGGAALLGLQGEEASPVIAWLLFGIGLPTLLLVALAWIRWQWALITVIALRSLEALTMFVPMGPGDWYSAPDRRGFYLMLVIVSLVVCGLMALGLRGRRR